MPTTIEFSFFAKDRLICVGTTANLIHQICDLGNGSGEDKA